MSALLIVALHGRSLARSARRGGHAVDVLDLYNDRDTRAYALRSQRVTERRGGFHAAALLATAAEFSPAPAALVAGSGFEENPALLASLAAGRKLYGNAPETIARVKDPRSFFSLLDTLGISHPEVSSSAPVDAEGWLSKRVGGHGGTHIFPADGILPADGIHPAGGASDVNSEHYFQRGVTGRSCSVLFLANGQKARVLGFNEQFTAKVNGGAYWYAGAINRADMQHRVRCEIAGKLDALVHACGLQGLNSVDFITDGGEYYVLEVNPRPSATMDLYDDDFPSGLFDWHLRACAGELPASAPVGKVRAHGVVYSHQPMRLSSRFRFPAWCSDTPPPGSEFPPGAPVCMVHADGECPAAVRNLIDRRRITMENHLMMQHKEEAA